MANEIVDAGLDELTADILGPADAPTGEQAPTEGVEPEPTETPAEPEQPSAPAPTAPGATPQAPAPQAPAPATVEVNGRQYTLEQLAAAIQTREQFPHLQEKYVALKRQEDARLKAEADKAAQGAPLPPEAVLSNMHSSFDPVVKDMVKSGFMEEDFAALYPNLAVGVAMYQQSLVSTTALLREQAQKIAYYEAEITSDRTISEMKNNMVALSGLHESLKPLAEPAVQDQFLTYLYNLDPKRSQLDDRDFWIRQWVAFNKDAYLNPANPTAPSAESVAKVRADAKRRATGAAVPGSRPAATPQAPASPLDEMIADEMAKRSGA